MWPTSLWAEALRRKTTWITISYSKNTCCKILKLLSEQLFETRWAIQTSRATAILCRLTINLLRCLLMWSEFLHKTSVIPLIWEMFLKKGWGIGKAENPDFSAPLKSSVTLHFQRRFCESQPLDYTSSWCLPGGTGENLLRKGSDFYLGFLQPSDHYEQWVIKWWVNLTFKIF